jgi:predicted nucleic acid-binding Zn ribbon protein
MRRRGPRPLAGALDRLTAQLAPATPLAAVQRVWSTAVPEPFAGACTPDGERDGVIGVACPSAVLAQELDLLSERVVERLNEQLGRPVVSGLRPQPRPPPS